MDAGTIGILLVAIAIATSFSYVIYKALKLEDD